MKNDLQAVADNILTLTLKVAPDLEAIEKDKDLLREATLTADQALTFASSLGAVVTKRGSDPSTKRVVEIDADAFDTLGEEIKTILFQKGVVKVSMKTTAGRKPSVEVKPIPAVARAA